MSTSPVPYDRGMVPFLGCALIHYFSKQSGHLIEGALNQGIPAIQIYSEFYVDVRVGF